MNIVIPKLRGGYMWHARTEKCDALFQTEGMGSRSALTQIAIQIEARGFCLLETLSRRTRCESGPQWGPAARGEGDPPRPLHARELSAPTPGLIPRPLVPTDGAGHGFATAARKPSAQCRWQVTDASLLPRGHASLAGAN